MCVSHSISFALDPENVSESFSEGNWSYENAKTQFKNGRVNEPQSAPNTMESYTLDTTGAHLYI
jgi:hypothetical protein